MTLAQMLRKARLSKDVTILIASKEIGIASSHLHAIERGKKLRPKMAILRKIADYYLIPYDDICVAAYRIPDDVFDKIAKSKELIELIPNLKV